MKSFLFSLLLLASTSALATQYEPEKIYLGNGVDEISLKDLAQQTPKGSIITIGEIHDNVAHHQHQIELIQALIDSGHKIAVGLEFFQYPYQEAISAYLDDQLPLTETDFLKVINWGDNDYGLYREQVKLAYKSSGQVFALNSPAHLNSKIKDVGLRGLNNEDRFWLPPSFTLGNDNYFERFKIIMSGHSHRAPEKMTDFFAAHSLWDDTIAWKVTEAKKKLGNTTLVVIIGGFHVDYFGGTPDRILKRSGVQPIVIAQTSVTNVPQETLALRIHPHPKYGPRGTFVWTSP